MKTGTKMYSAGKVGGFLCFLWAAIVCFVSSFALAEGSMGVTVVTSAGEKVRFVAEVAETQEEQARGLMLRASMADNAAMLFDFAKAKKVAMWMKNTLISLDILFIEENGRIVYIKEKAVPLSLDNIMAEQPVRYVLEIKGGVVEKAGIKVGDRIMLRPK